MKLALTLITLFLAGCTTSSPSIVKYKISPTIKTQKFDAKMCESKSLKVGQMFSDSNLKSMQMLYTQDKYKEFGFSESGWSESPVSSLSKSILKSIKAAGLFASVSSYHSRSRSDYVLESNIEEFIQHFEEDNSKSYASVVISFTLVDTKTLQVVDSITLSQEVKAKELNANAGVAALNEALSTVLTQTNSWLSGVCK